MATAKIASRTMELERSHPAPRRLVPPSTGGGHLAARKAEDRRGQHDMEGARLRSVVCLIGSLFGACLYLAESA